MPCHCHLRLAPPVLKDVQPVHVSACGSSGQAVCESELTDVSCEPLQHHHIHQTLVNPSRVNSEVQAAMTVQGLAKKHTSQHIFQSHLCLATEASITRNGT